MADHDWSRFFLRIPIKADKDNIFQSFTTQEGLESWFLRKAAFTSQEGKSKKPTERIAPGDRYEWLWHGWPDETVEKGEVIEMNGKDRFCFTFGKAGRVTIALKNERGQNMVELLQDQIPTTEEGQVYYHLGCTKGWMFYLTNLKSILEGGIDLRNRDVELKNVITS